MMTLKTTLIRSVQLSLTGHSTRYQFYRQRIRS